MAENEDNTRVQPNLARFSESMAAAAEEAARFPNLPAFDASSQLSRAIERLTQVVTENTQAVSSLRTDVADLKTEVATIKVQILVTDLNSVARVQNASVQNATDILSPFTNPATNTGIEGFPLTSDEIRRMPAGTLNTVLEGLGLSTGGNTEERKKRLRSHIGLRPNQGA